MRSGIVGSSYTLSITRLAYRITLGASPFLYPSLFSMPEIVSEIKNRFTSLDVCKSKA